jgi:hypothetical protein
MCVFIKEDVLTAFPACVSFIDQGRAGRNGVRQCVSYKGDGWRCVCDCASKAVRIIGVCGSVCVAVCVRRRKVLSCMYGRNLSCVRSHTFVAATCD